MSLFRKNSVNEENTKSKKVNDEDKETDISSFSEERETPQKGEKKMEEIYSTKDKHIRYKSEMPLEAEAIRITQEKRKEGLKNGDVEIKLEDTGEIDDIELKAELDDDVNISEEIIEDIGKFQDVHSSNTETLSFDEKYYAENDVAELPALSKAEKVVNYVPVYQHESKVNKIRIKAGKFSQIVESEYDQYLISNDPTQSGKKIDISNIPENKSLIYHLSQLANKYKGESKYEDQRQVKRREIENERIKRQQREDEERQRRREENDIDEEDIIHAPKKERQNRTRVERVGQKNKSDGIFVSIGKFFSVMFAIIGSMFISKGKETQTMKISSDTGSIDYEDRQDAKYVLSQIKKNIQMFTTTLIILIIIAVCLVLLSIVEGSQGVDFLSDFTQYGPLIYCIATFVLFVIAGIVYKSPLLGGIKALKNLKGNADTAIAIGFIGCLIQCVVSFIIPTKFLNGEYHLYALAVVLAMILNTVGRIFIELRVKLNFKFITSKSPAYAGKIFDDEEMASRMISGTTVRKPYVSYQHATDFLSDYLKISYAPDPCEEFSGKIAPVVAIASILIGIIYFLVSKDIISAITSVVVMCCIGISFSAITAANIPLFSFSKQALKYNAMVSGFPSVRQFCDTSAIMVKASELFPRGSVKLESIRDLVGLGLDDILLSAAAVLREANSPMANVFHYLEQENPTTVTRVESVLYEEKAGIVGWVNGVRILIGNRTLMDRYHIDIKSQTVEERYEKRGQFVSFIAFGGQLAAQVVVSYHPNSVIEKNLLKAEENGICFIVSSTDVNLTSDTIANIYSLYSKTVKVLSIGYANSCNESMDRKDDTARAYLATRGKFSSLCRAISGCVKIKSNLTMAMIVQIFGIVLGILLCAIMSLYAGVARLTVFNILLYIVFWVIATLLAGILRRP